MKTIGVISDTHGLLRPQALAALEGSALIVHAGDVGKLEILEQLRTVAPVHAVHGNTDWGEVRGALPYDCAVDLGAEEGVLGAEPVGPVAYVLHDLAELALDPAGGGFRVVISGHTHRPEVRERGGVIYLNPGSAGPKRFDLPTTVAVLEVEGAEVGTRVIELDV